MSFECVRSREHIHTFAISACESWACNNTVVGLKADFMLYLPRHTGYDYQHTRKLVYYDAVTLLWQADHRDRMYLHKRYLARNTRWHDKSNQRAVILSRSQLSGLHDCAVCNQLVE